MDGEGNVKMEYHWLPKNNFCTGSTFVAKPKAIEEDDGWIVTFAHDEENDISYVRTIKYHPLPLCYQISQYK